jgi:putative PIN family toxin of toxin-antitoxin system
VIDTSVLVAAIRSNSGASNLLLRAGLNRRFELLISTPLVLEYEAVMTRAEHLLASGLTADEIEELLDVLCGVGNEVPMTRSWRPQLSDPDDEMVLATSINGNADAIVTFNRGDFASVDVKFNIEIISPQEALGRIDRHEEKQLCAAPSAISL